MQEIKRSLFVEAKEWFDKTGGNSYFSARLSIDGQVIHALPFQYGYESQFEHEAKKWLHENGYLTIEELVRPLWNLKTKGIDVYTVKYSATQRETKRWGEI